MSSGVVFLSGKKVNLRPYNKNTDLALVHRWINAPEVRRFIENINPITITEEEKLMDGLTSDPKSKFFIIETKRGNAIGVMALSDINWIDRTAVSGAFIGEKSQWGIGYGTDAKMAFLYYAFNTLGLRKICTEIRAFNERSIRYNEKCGYKKEGIRKRQNLCNGEYVDAVLMAVFKEDFIPIWNAYTKK